MRRNRGYKKEQGRYRDARKFILAVEGEQREVDYFQALAEDQTRIDLTVLGPDERHLSAPRYVVERITKYLEEYDLDEDDQVWLVLDTDRWSTEQLREVERTCKDHGWNLAISNPCFELWLYLHYADLPEDPPSSSKEWKKELSRRVATGYRPEEALHHLDEAIRRAEALETDPNNAVPPPLQTTLYRIGKAIKPFLS